MRIACMSRPRIVSMLPSATEMIFSLGLGDRLVAVSHECDFPAAARRKPKVVFDRFPTRGVASAAIDRRVAKALRNKESLCAIDLDVLREAKPDVIVTQELCDVCAITGTDLQIALKNLRLSPRIIAQTPRGLSGILEDLVELGMALGVEARARRLARLLRGRMERLRKKISRLPRPRVFAMEWTDPPYACGHWVPEQVELAGGYDILGAAGRDSARTTWEAIERGDPEIVVLMPCGFDARRAAREATRLARLPQWKRLRAVRDGRVFAVDANAYFSRPGPRAVDGAELLGSIIHPEAVRWSGSRRACSRVRI